jgi:hypothetical protein
MKWHWSDFFPSSSVSTVESKGSRFYVNEASESKSEVELAEVLAEISC